MIRDRAMTFFALDDVLRLVAEQADRIDVAGQSGLSEGQHLLGRVGDRKQLRRRLVDLHVGRLGRQGDGHHQSEGILELQFRARVVRQGQEPVEQRGDPRLLLRRQASFRGDFVHRRGP